MSVDLSQATLESLQNQLHYVSTLTASDMPAQAADTIKALSDLYWAEVTARKDAERKIGNALSEMDHSHYGDPEVPFRMRACLT